MGSKIRHPIKAVPLDLLQLDPTTVKIKRHPTTVEKLQQMPRKDSSHRLSSQQTNNYK